MRNIWLVIKHDAAATLSQVSFWILTLALPVLLLFFNGYRVIQENRPAEPAPEDEAAAPAEAPLPLGLVDEAGLIAEVPPDVPPDLWVDFADEAAGRAALEAGEIEQLVVIPADYVASGDVAVYDRDFAILRDSDDSGVAFTGGRSGLLGYLLSYNLTGDQELTAALGNPTPGNLARYHALEPAPAETATENGALAEIVSTILPYVFYGLLLLGSSWLLRCVASEKENRTAELLLMRVGPRQLLVGKILAMSAVLMVQVVAWAGGGILMLNWGADVMRVARLDFPPGFLALALLYLILGYLLFASLMAAAGAVAATPREAGPMTIVLVIPLMPTLMFAPAFLDDPNGVLPVVLSLIPFSAPSAMVTRLAVAPVPPWQLALSLGLLALTTYGAVSLAARFFRPGNLLSGESFSWARFVKGWRRA